MTEPDPDTRMPEQPGADTTDELPRAEPPDDGDAVSQIEEQERQGWPDEPTTS